MTDTERLEWLAKYTATIHRGSPRWDGHTLFSVEWFDPDANLIKGTRDHEDVRDAIDQAIRWQKGDYSND